MPQYANSYRFLTTINNKQLQQIYEMRNHELALQQTNDLLGDFMSKLTIWSELEKQHEFKKDQEKTQKKYQEIYESLKQHFGKETDEKQKLVKQFLKDLEGK